MALPAGAPVAETGSARLQQRGEAHVGNSVGTTQLTTRYPAGSALRDIVWMGSALAIATGGVLLIWAML